MDDILKIIGALASLFAIYKLVVEVVLTKFIRRKDEYSFAKSYILDLERGSEHLYTLEKGFFALTGKIYSIPEIKLLLSQSSPSMMINLRRDCSSFVTFNEELNIYEWKGRYSNEFIQKYAGNWYFLWYMVTASLALLPVYASGLYSLNIFPVAAFSVSLLVVAVSCLVQQSNLSNTKKFMREIVHPSPNNLSQQDASSGAAA